MLSPITLLQTAVILLGMFCIFLSANYLRVFWKVKGEIANVMCYIMLGQFVGSAACLVFAVNSMLCRFYWMPEHTCTRPEYEIILRLVILSAIINANIQLANVFKKHMATRKKTQV